MNLETSAVRVPGSDAVDACRAEIDACRWQMLTVFEEMDRQRAQIAEAFAPLRRIGEQMAEAFAPLRIAALDLTDRMQAARARLASLEAVRAIREARRRVRSLGAGVRRRAFSAIKATHRAVRHGLRAVWPLRRSARTGPPVTRRPDEIEPGVAVCHRPRGARTVAPTAPAVMFGRTFSPHAPPCRPAHRAGRAGYT